MGPLNLLMLSGIGPADELSKHGVTPLVDLPGVGQNLIEHPFLPMAWRALPETFDCAMRADRAALSVLRWALFGTGIFATNGAAGSLFLRTAPGLDRPDMQLICPAVQISAGDVWYPFISKPTHTLVCALSMIRQDSRGHVTLRSANPLDPPRIKFNLFKEQSDVERMIRGIRAARAIYNSAPLSTFHAEETLARRSGYSPTPNSRSSCAASARSRSIRWARAAWARSATRVQWSMQNCACAACRRCASSTPRSCRTYRAATPTRRQS